MEGSKRILLNNFSKFLLSAGISYQNCFFNNSLSLHGRQNKCNKNEARPSKSDNFTLLCDLMEHLMEHRNIYALSQSCGFYSNIAKCLQGKF